MIDNDLSNTKADLFVFGQTVGGDEDNHFLINIFTFFTKVSTYHMFLTWIRKFKKKLNLVIETDFVAIRLTCSPKIWSIPPEQPI